MDIDRNLLYFKSFLALVNLLSSYQAVYELIGNLPLPNKAVYSLREVPSSVVVSGTIFIPESTLLLIQFVLYKLSKDKFENPDVAASHFF